MSADIAPNDLVFGAGSGVGLRTRHGRQGEAEPNDHHEGGGCDAAMGCHTSIQTRDDDAVNPLAPEASMCYNRGMANNTKPVIVRVTPDVAHWDAIGSDGDKVTLVHMDAEIAEGPANLVGRTVTIAFTPDRMARMLENMGKEIVAKTGTTCGHPEWRDGRCGDMRCRNSVGRA